MAYDEYKEFDDGERVKQWKKMDRDEWRDIGWKMIEGLCVLMAFQLHHKSSALAI